MFEKLYTNTLFYLAQVFGVRGDNKQAAAHCHITLQRQLEAEVGGHDILCHNLIIVPEKVV